MAWYMYNVDELAKAFICDLAHGRSRNSNPTLAAIGPQTHTITHFHIRHFKKSTRVTLSLQTFQSKVLSEVDT